MLINEKKPETKHKKHKRERSSSDGGDSDCVVVESRKSAAKKKEKKEKAHRKKRSRSNSHSFDSKKKHRKDHETFDDLIRNKATVYKKHSTITAEDVFSDFCRELNERLEAPKKAAKAALKVLILVPTVSVLFHFDFRFKIFIEHTIVSARAPRGVSGRQLCQGNRFKHMSVVIVVNFWKHHNLLFLQAARTAQSRQDVAR